VNELGCFMKRLILIFFIVAITAVPVLEREFIMDEEREGR